MNLKLRHISIIISITIVLAEIIGKKFFDLSITSVEIMLTGIFSAAISILFGIEDIRILMQSRLGFIEKIGRLNLLKNFKSISNSFNKINEYDDSMLWNHGNSALNQIVTECDELAEGRITTIDKTLLTNYPIKMASELTISLDATVMWKEDTLDDKSLRAEPYLNEIRTAITERGVRVRRIFLVPEKSIENDQRLIDRMESDKNDGASVRFLIDSDWESSRYSNDPEDIGIFDKNRLFVYGRLNSRGERPADIFFTKSRIKIYQSTFDANWNRATVA